MANRTLVKLDDAVFEVKDKDNRLEANQLKPDDLFEVSILDKGVEQFIKNDINKIANEAYLELQEDFKHRFKANVLKVVGFQNRYGGWEVDHVNGCSSHITDFMSNKVKNMFNEEFDKLLQPEIEKMLTPLKTSLVREFKEEFRREVKSQIRSSAEEAARDFLSEIMKSQMKAHQTQILEKASETFLGRPSKAYKNPKDEE